MKDGGLGTTERVEVDVYKGRNERLLRKRGGCQGDEELCHTGSGRKWRAMTKKTKGSKYAGGEAHFAIASSDLLIQRV